MQISGRKIQIYPAEGAVVAVWVCTFGQEGEELAAAYQAQNYPPIALITVQTNDWDDVLSPWAAPALGKGQQPFGGHADDFLPKLTGEIVPKVSAEANIADLPQIVAGYSLAGLFSLYALTKTDCFCAAASVSGSLWYPEFSDYFTACSLPRRPDAVYLSYGDREPMTKHPLLRKVGTETERCFRHLQALSVPSILEVNEGNHFKDSALRTVKGIAWLAAQKNTADR